MMNHHLKKKNRCCVRCCLMNCFLKMILRKNCDRLLNNYRLKIPKKNFRLSAMVYRKECCCFLMVVNFLCVQDVNNYRSCLLVGMPDDYSVKVLPWVLQADCCLNFRVLQLNLVCSCLYPAKRVDLMFPAVYDIWVLYIHCLF